MARHRNLVVQPFCDELLRGGLKELVEGTAAVGEVVLVNEENLDA